MTANDPEKSAFESAFIAASYLFERRGDDLIAPLRDPSESSRKLVQALSRPERDARAAVLAREIARIAQSLEARRLK